MGLLSRISNSSSIGTSSGKTETSAGGMGLLAKAQVSSNRTCSSFQEWADRNGYEHCGIFSNIHGMMVITHAYGLDCHTVANSVSSKDFWNGTLSAEEPLNYSSSDNELYNFMQFFSLELRSSIKHISFIKIPGSPDFSVLMVFNTNEGKEINLNKSVVESLRFNISNKIDFSSLTRSLNYQLYVIGVNEIVRNAIKNVQLPEENIKKAVSKCIYAEIFYLLKKGFPSPSLLDHNDSGKIKLALSNINIDDQLLQAHINLLLQDIVDNSSLSVSLENFSTPDNLESLKSFLEN